MSVNRTYPVSNWPIYILVLPFSQYIITQVGCWLLWRTGRTITVYNRVLPLWTPHFLRSADAILQTGSGPVTKQGNIALFGQQTSDSSSAILVFFWLFWQPMARHINGLLTIFTVFCGLGSLGGHSDLIHAQEKNDLLASGIKSYFLASTALEPEYPHCY